MVQRFEAPRIVVTPHRRPYGPCDFRPGWNLLVIETFLPHCGALIALIAGDAQRDTCGPMVEMSSFRGYRIAVPCGHHDSPEET